MIITRQKTINEILRLLKDAEKVFLVGCAQCATLCKTGGEEELAAAQMMNNAGFFGRLFGRFRR